MGKITVKVLDYYNKPCYYPYMPNELFLILEQAFLDDKEYIEVPADLFNKMIDDTNNTILITLNYSLN